MPADNFIQVPLDATQNSSGNSGKKIDTSELIVGANTVERERIVVADPVNASSLGIVTPWGDVMSSLDPGQLFYDTFDGGLDTLNRWKTPSVGGTGIAATSVPGSGSTTLDSGTTANSFSLLQSQPTFQPTEPGFIYTTFRINIENPVLTTGYRFWGLGQCPAAPTIATPVNEGCGWEVRTDGKLYAVTYAGGARTVIQDLSAATGNAKQPTDANAHKYFMWYRGDITYWAIDTVNNVVASFLTGASGPNYNNFPLILLAVSNSGTHETLVLNGCSVGDTARNNVRISDDNYPWRSLEITADGTARVSSSIPNIVQKISAASTGSVASLAQTFNSILFPGNTIVVVCGVGNGTTPTVTDTNGNTYVRATGVANGTAFNVNIFYAVNAFTGARNTVTVNNGGATASIAMEMYEFTGLLIVTPAVVDVSNTAVATSTTPASAALSPFAVNEYALAAIGVGTAAQTITPAAGWTNDSGQLNPTTPAGLFSFISMSQFIGSPVSVTPSATIVSEPWAVCAVLFRPPLIGIEGSVVLTDGATKVNVISATNALKSDSSSWAGTALGAPTNFGTTPGAVVAGLVNSSAFVGTVAAVAASAGVQKVGISGSSGVALDAAAGTIPTNNLAAISLPSTGAGAACSIGNAASLTVLNIKATAGNVYGATIVNKTAGVIYLQFYNTAGTPTLGTSVVWWIPIAASATLVIQPGSIALGNFTTGIGIGASTTPTSTGTPGTAPDVTIWFK